MNKLLPLIFLILFQSCQSARTIKMINETEEEARVIVSVKEDSLRNSPFFISNEKETTFIVYPGRNGVIDFSCGIGNWTPDFIQNMADDLESIVIKWNKGETKLTTEAEITSFLKERRKGLDKGRVEIRIVN